MDFCVILFMCVFDCKCVYSLAHVGKMPEKGRTLLLYTINVATLSFGYSGLGINHNFRQFNEPESCQLQFGFIELHTILPDKKIEYYRTIVEIISFLLAFSER